MRALGEFTEEQIASGAKSCQKWTKDFPPTLGQFRQMCMEVTNAPNFTERRMETEIKSLTDFTKPCRADGPIAQREKQRIADILAGKEVETKDESMTRLALHRRWQS